MAKRRSSKKIPKYQQEQLDEYYSVTNEKTEKVFMKQLEFDLTNKQKQLMRLINKNKIITVTGPPGTSKTFISCFTAVDALLKGDYERIILSKSTDVLSGTKELGHLPGTLDEKLQVYIESFLDNFYEMLIPSHFKKLWDNKIIEFKPAQFMRGRSLKNSFIIIDEFQNFDIKTLKSIVTRLGKGSKMIFLGDSKQNDINKKYLAADKFQEILRGIDGCDEFKFTREDIVREQILIDIIDRFEEFEDNDNLTPTKNNT
jgi:phosphate starvation-inducible PhoH-like protein